MTFVPRQLVPNITVLDHAGKPHALWDFRQKFHVVLLHDPQASAAKREQWLSAIYTDRKQWEWLNTRVLIVSKAPEEMAPGAYLIDRYGQLLSYFPLDHWTFDAIEKELVYYEARHC